jgi:DNA-directed RNA polymerase specialized sigma subunit
MTEQQAVELAKEFKETNSSKAFDELWKATVNMVEPYKYYDPTGARTTDDFLQVTRIGLFQALNTFKEGAGSTLLSWARMRMHQLIVKELRTMRRNNYLGYKISLDTTIFDTENNNSTVEQMIYEQLVAADSYDAASMAWSEELYWTIIADVDQRVSFNRHISKCFGLRLVFPNISRDTISKMLKVGRPAVSQYFDTIRKCISLSAEKYAF